MIKVLLCCAGGFSSSALSVKVTEELKKMNMEEELYIGFSPFSIIHEHMHNYDIIVCCPHLRYRIADYNSKYIKNQIPIYILPPLMYGRVNPEDIYQDAIDLIELFKMKKENPICFPGEEDTMKIKRFKSYRKIYLK